jgi:glycosyltransferase involved in cell wall biosynthesis
VPSLRAVVIAFRAARTIVATLDRVPATVCGIPLGIAVYDDASDDDTATTAREWAESGRTALVVRHPCNLGYGGNQVAAYADAAEDGIDVVVVLHGDGQHAPEHIEQLVQPILDDRLDAVFGSRMLVHGDARRGGMPPDRYLGNRVLSALQNALTGAALSEWHSGFRAYRVSTLAQVGLESLPLGFDFDTAITLRLLAVGARIDEVAIPTFYGDERSHVRPCRDGLRILARTLAWRLSRSRQRRRLQRRVNR